MPPPPPSRSILIVEDDPAVRTLLVEVLGAAGLAVTAVGSAEEALGVLAKFLPGLVLLDLGMPGGAMQGMDLLATIRETPAWKNTPVVILSAFGDVVNRDVTSRLGVRAVLSKPLAGIDSLLRTVHEAMC